ncbi:MAG: histidine triad nucleotide-binding protein [Clostridia bacterium]|nr:histidine triad nucleotide-binding protein [Clostridia bacterium]
MDCIFCKIAAGEIPCKKIYEDERVLAFFDIQPQAPVHALIIPKTHVASADELTAQTAGVAADVFGAVPKVARACGLTRGYRVITNVGEDGCQSVRHLHCHLLGGRKLPEEMG